MIPGIEFLTSTIGRYVIGGVGVLALFLAFRDHEQKIGAVKAVARIEKQDQAHVKKANAAGARSRDPHARGVQDKYVRADD